MREGFIPPTVNWQHPDPACRLNLSAQPRFMPFETALVNSHGLSGHEFVSGASTMSIDLTLLAAITAFVVSFIAYWSNPKRGINRMFLSLSVHTALWLICLGSAVKGGVHGQNLAAHGVGGRGVYPLHLWFVKESIVRGIETWSGTLFRSLGWFVVCAVLAGLYADRSVCRDRVEPRGAWFWLGLLRLRRGQSSPSMSHSAGKRLLQARQQTGSHRLELQIVLLGGSTAAGTIILLMALRAILAEPWLILLQPISVIVFYTGTVVAITTSRIFDARQILLVGLQKILLVGLIAGFAYVMMSALELAQLPEALAFLITAGLALWFAALLNRWLDRLFQFYPQATEARQAAFAAARRETRLDKLEHDFLAVLKGWGQSDNALIRRRHEGRLRGGGVELVGDGWWRRRCGSCAGCRPSAWPASARRRSAANWALSWRNTNWVCW